MFHRFNTLTVIFTLIALAPTNGVNADWFHNFDDGQVPDSLVVNLSPRIPNSTTFSVDATSEYLTMTESAPVTQGGAPVLIGLDEREMFTDVRVAATVNLDTSHRSVSGLTARTSMEADDIHDYEFVIAFVPGVEATGTASFLRLDQPAFPGDLLELNSLEHFGITTRLDIDRSYYLEFDVIGDQLTGRVFDEKGGIELLSMSYTDPTPLGPGYAGVGTTFETNRPFVPIGSTYDDISAIAIRPGDFDIDGMFSVADVDMLTTEIVAETDNSAFDMSDDGVVDQIDLTAWLSDAANHNGFARAYLPGDSNLDGSVDSTDLNNLALNWQQNVALWSGGDFTANGVVDSTDLNALALNWRKSTPMASVVSAPVPEPSALFLALVGLATVWRRSRSS